MMIKVLIADDYEIVRVLMRYALEKGGGKKVVYEPVSAACTHHQGNQYFSKQVAELAHIYMK